MNRLFAVALGAALLGSAAGCSEGDRYAPATVPPSVAARQTAPWVSAPPAWRVYSTPAGQPGGTVVTVDNGDTNAPALPVVKQTTPAASPPRQDPIQEAPALQGSEPGKGPI